MGNTDSQYSSFILPGKPRPCSLKFPSSKDQGLSPHGWWRGTDLGTVYKARIGARTTSADLSPHKNSQPYLSRHYDYVSNTAGGGGGGGGDPPRSSSPLRCGRDGGWDGCYSSGGLQVPSAGAPDVDPLGSRSSPKVLFSKDGSLRVEFTNIRHQQEEEDHHRDEEEEGNSVAARTNVGPSDAGQRTSNGSSLSSEGSWYDSPWGTGCGGGGGGGGGGDAMMMMMNDNDNVFLAAGNHQMPHHPAFPSPGCHDNSNTTTGSSSSSSFSGGTVVGRGGEFGSFGSSSHLRLSQLAGSRGYLGNGYNTCSSGRTEDSGIGDSLMALPADQEQELERMASAEEVAVALSGRYSSPSLINPFPLPSQFQDAPGLAHHHHHHHHHHQQLHHHLSQQHHHASVASALDAATLGTQRELCDPAGMPYSSLTLPCRKPSNSSSSNGNTRKDSLKSRIRKLSDWTGSLSRKKRRLQDPSSNEPTDAFRTNNLSSADPQAGASYWALSLPPQLPLPQPQPPLHLHLHLQAGSGSMSGSAFGSSMTLHSQQQLHNNMLRQNIYQNFMQELETGGGGGGGGGGAMVAEMGPPTSEGEGEAGEAEVGESSSSSLGSLEQLDLMCEKEQGVVRRAGWLSFKPLITPHHKERKLELVARRKWRQYWVTLKGCMLLFYETYGKASSSSSSSGEQDLSPSYALLAEDSIVQAVPEHPKKEHVFCLSNAYGDVYLFQAANQTDVENWVTALHSASASLLARRQGKEDTVRLLRGQTRGLLQKIDMDAKMKKMAELQLSVVSDQKNRKAIESQIQQWDQNLEGFHMELFRVRCYLASLQGGELPNPKSLLAAASRPSKMALSRLGIFSVSSFHALICTRDEANLRRRTRSLSRRCRTKRGLFSSLKGLDSLTKRSHARTDHKHTSTQQRPDGVAKLHATLPPEGQPWDSSLESLVCVHMPDGRAVTVPIRQDSLVADVLTHACKGHQLEPCLFGLRVKKRMAEEVELYTASSTDTLKELAFDELEVFPLNVFTQNLSRPDTSSDFGFAVTGHVDSLGRSHIYVSELNPEGLAFSEGLRAGDEILVLNGSSVSSCDLGLMQAYFSQPSVSLVLWREEAAPLSDQQSPVWPDCQPTAEPSYQAFPPPSSQPQHVEHFPPWPSDSPPSQEVPEGSIAAASGSEDGALQNVPSDNSGSPRTWGEDLKEDFAFQLAWLSQALKEKLAALLDELAACFDELASCFVCKKDKQRPDGFILLSAENVGSLYQTFPEVPVVEAPEGHRNPYCSDAPPQRQPCPRHMSITEHLRKVIQELLDTEKSYVKDLGCLFEIYLKPLQTETFLSQDEMESLFGSLPEMLDFQRLFLHTLEERIACSPDFSILQTPEQFKKLLFSLGGSFLNYADHFKLYSGFCANHIKVQKVLERAKTDQAFKEFLEARNPTKQHSSTLESYLIKPVQRVLKYPLLLRELVSLTDTHSDEHSHLTEALRAMEKVASHINEMQKIYEDYGTVFDQLVAEQSSREKEVTEISMGEFLLHSSALWLNPHPSLGRMRKEPELTLFLFKRAAILVYRESTKLKKRMTSSRSAFSQGDLDPFKFRWLIPVSALQVRLGNTAGSDNPGIWELVHTKSEVEGRPETVFQLCSSDLVSKANVLKTIRSQLRESAKRPVPGERSYRDHLSTFRKPQPAPTTQAGPWVPRNPPHHTHPNPYAHPNRLRPAHMDPDSDCHSEPPMPSRARDYPSHHSLTLDKKARLHSLTSVLEAQLQRLNFTDEAASSGGGGGGGGDSEVGSSSSSSGGDGSSRSSSRLTVVGDRQGCQSSMGLVESQSSMELNCLLARDFSVQSLSSVVNEDCFYDSVMGIQKAVIPTQ